jgi:enoyl-CoA hydratase
MTPDVIIRTEGAAGRITLNRPAALHGLTTAMCEAMQAALLRWRDDPAVKLVMIDHAPGTRGFCAGGDIRQLVDDVANDPPSADAFFRTEYRLNALIHSYPKPYVAFIDGVVMGGGVGVSVHGRFVVATERTVFAMPETGIGFFPDVGGGWFLPRLGAPMGMWLGLTGERLKGGDVVSAGVATHFVGSSGVEAVKASLLDGDFELLHALEWDEAGSYNSHVPGIDRCFSKDTVEAIMAELQSLGGEWADAQLAALRSRSPLALKVAHRQLKEGRAARTFEDVMRMEFRIALRMIRRHDFAEGVRAVVIDKDNKPAWSPASLAEVSDGLVDQVFASLGEDELTFLDA